MLQSMLREIESRAEYIGGQLIETIYLGGGTPSILTGQEVRAFLNVISQHFSISSDCEITLEANPDDLNLDILDQFYEAGVNRLSVGVQSFDDDVLKYMNRSHTAKQSFQVLDFINAGPFSNYSVDLIFGHHHSSIPFITKELEQLENHSVPHISCYSLTIEPDTVFGRWNRDKKLLAIEDGRANDEFLYIHDTLIAKNYMHYEISNYAKQGSESKHNKNYWLKKPYLGIGPGAHSYNGTSRRWNINNNSKYINATTEGSVYHTEEVLSLQDRYNEYVLVRLRVKEGCRIEELRNFGIEYVSHFHTIIQEHINTNKVVESNGVYTLSLQGMLMADSISSDLFVSNT